MTKKSSQNWSKLAKGVKVKRPKTMADSARNSIWHL